VLFVHARHVQKGRRSGVERAQESSSNKNTISYSSQDERRRASNEFTPTTARRITRSIIVGINALHEKSLSRGH
jgi:hypothetical protein